jgi:sugar lactone lactonase YvrE
VVYGRGEALTPMLVQKLDVPVSTLGEGPVWSDRDGCLYYVDIVSLFSIELADAEGLPADLFAI